jgi:hypothetical protein
LFLGIVLAGLFMQLFFVCSAFADSPHYKYFRAGSPTDVQTKTEGGFALMGGGKDLDRAFQWMCERSGGSDFLILRANGDDAYNACVQDLCHLNSVATLIMPDRAAAEDPFAAETIRKAEAVFIAGGDQANYINFWMGTPVQQALNDAIARNIPIGGTSAGLAVQGEFIYSAQGDTPDGPDLSSPETLSNPFNPRVTIVHHFLNNPLLRDMITDTHFSARDRMGSGRWYSWREFFKMAGLVIFELSRLTNAQQWSLNRAESPPLWCRFRLLSRHHRESSELPSKHPFDLSRSNRAELACQSAIQLAAMVGQRGHDLHSLGGVREDSFDLAGRCYLHEQGIDWPT